MSEPSAIPSLVEPPPSEIMPFAAFENLMNSTDIDEFYKYYDSDGTVDLEDTYDGSSCCSDENSHAVDEDRAADPEKEDPNALIREAERRDRAARSRHNDQALQDLVFDTQLVLERLSIAAQPILEEQPMSTRVVLANQAVGIFERYGGHGSMYRFSEDARRFLEDGERVKRAGILGRDRTKDAVLRFAPVNPTKGDGIVDEKKKGSKRKGSGEAGQQREGGRKERKVEQGLSVGAVKVRIEKTEVGQVAAAETEKKKKDETVTDGQGVLKFRPILPNIKTSPPHLQIPGTLNGRTLLSPASPSSALARFNLNSPLPHAIIQPANRHAYSGTTHPTLNALLAAQPYDPISLNFSWPATSRQNAHPTMPTPGLLDALNNILHLFNAEGRFMLSYYVRKFDTPAEYAGTGPGAPTASDGSAQKVEPPHALFRLGIAQYLWGKVGKVIDHKEVDELGLNPEARSLLADVWERHPSTAAWWHDSLLAQASATRSTNGGAEGVGTDEDPYGHESDFDPNASAYDTSDAEDEPAERDRKLRRKVARAERRRKRDEIEARKRQMALGGLNPWERVVLARATNVSVKTVDTYWEDMREKTKAWGAMKMWCAAMEKKMIRKAKVEERW